MPGPSELEDSESGSNRDIALQPSDCSLDFGVPGAAQECAYSMSKIVCIPLVSKRVKFLKGI